MLAGTMKESTLDSLQGQFYRVRIVNGRTNQTVRSVPYVTKSYIRWLHRTLNSHEELQVETDHGVWVTIKNLKSCNMCFGYGMWPDIDEQTGAQIPLTEYEAKKDDCILSEPCPICASDNYEYFYISENDDEKKEEKFKSFDSFMSDFVNEVKKSKNIVKSKAPTYAPPMPW